METIRLFDNDSYLTEFDAKVAECEQVGDFYEIILDKTAFFPEEGGQTCDKGVLSDQSIIHVSIKENVIRHRVKEAIEVGTEVHGSIDFEHRFDNMQCHSGEHIMSGIIHGLFGYDNVGFHLSEQTETLDFNGTFTDEELLDIEDRANRIVSENRPVSVAYYSNKEVKSINYRSKKEIPGTIRIVTIEGVDVCACCAPHVSKTGEIGMIKIASAEHFRGGTRITLLCGRRALLDYRVKQEGRQRISQLLSAKPENVPETVEKLKADYDKARYNLVSMQEQQLLLKENILRMKGLDVYAEYPEIGLYNLGGFILVFDCFAEAAAQRNLVNRLTADYEGIVVCMKDNGESGFSYIAGSGKCDARVVGEAMKKEFAGKGGGKPQMIQGSVNAGEADIVRVMKGLVE